jgi:hypothetical protein
MRQAAGPSLMSDPSRQIMGLELLTGGSILLGLLLSRGGQGRSGLRVHHTRESRLVPLKRPRVHETYTRDKTPALGWLSTSVDRSKDSSYCSPAEAYLSPSRGRGLTRPGTRDKTQPIGSSRRSST